MTVFDAEATLQTELSKVAPSYLLALPEKPSTFPALVYQRVSTVPQRTQNKDGFDSDRFQVSVYAKSYATVKTTANSVVSQLESGTAFRFASKENRYDIKEADTGLLRTILEFFIWE